MAQAESLREQAETCMARARASEGSTVSAESLEALRSAVLLYTAADLQTRSPEEAGPLTRPRADSCRLFAQALADSGRHAEAANIYQEATDLFGLLQDTEAQSLAGECARRLLQSVAALREQPQERLHLLIARYERIQHQLGLEPGSEARQADCCMHIARVYQRRDRPAESSARYREALELLEISENAGETALARAECHHRLATLLAGPLASADEAVRHYRHAIVLYRDNEPFAYGFQQSLEVCRAAMSRAEEKLTRQSQRRTLD